MTDELRQICATLTDLPAPWFVAGGWAIDLWLGHATRPHKDIDIVILRRHQHVLRRGLIGWHFTYAVPGAQRASWPEDETLEPPIHETYASYPASGAEVEFLLNESDASRWVYRRNSAVLRDLAELGYTTDAGIPILNPAVVLLYKSKQPTHNDHRDFDCAVPTLHKTDREWLRRALRQCDAEHPWLARL